MNASGDQFDGAAQSLSAPQKSVDAPPRDSSLAPTPGAPPNATRKELLNNLHRELAEVPEYRVWDTFSRLLEQLSEAVPDTDQRVRAAQAVSQVTFEQLRDSLNQYKVVLQKQNGLCASYIARMQSAIQDRAKRIETLEKRIHALETELDQVRNEHQENQETLTAYNKTLEGNFNAVHNHYEKMLVITANALNVNLESPPIVPGTLSMRHSTNLASEMAAADDKFAAPRASSN